MFILKEIIAQKREAMLGEHDDIGQLELSYSLPNTNNEKMEDVEDTSFYEIKVKEEHQDKVIEKTYCDSVQFLFQDVFKHTFLISSRGIGKTYSVHDYVIKTAMDFIKKDLPEAVYQQNRQEVKLPIMVGYILQNALYNAPLIQTLNEILSKYKIEKYVDCSVETTFNNRIAIEVRVDLGGINPYKKLYTFGETFYLTQPNLARGRQYTDLSFVIFDEFEKAFAKSLMDEDKVVVDTDKLFDNFLDIMNSFQRNDKLRFLYLGNITNLNSIIWDYLKIVNFDFKSQVNEHVNEKTDIISRILILNLIPLFTNQTMSNYFEDLTTLGISEEELFQVSALVNEEHVIEKVDEKCFIVFDDNHIFYFRNGICNIDRVDIKTMEKLNDMIAKKFDHEVITIRSDEDIINEYLNDQGYAINQYTIDMVPLKMLRKSESKKVTSKLKIYSVGRLLLDGTIHVDNKVEFFKSFNKNSYKFKSLREYFIYTNLINK